MENLKETTTASELIFDGKILHLYRDDITLPNGKPAERELIRHIGAVCVIPVTDDGYAVMERQYRYPVGEVLLEIPAGKLDSRDEDHEEAARRELREETGYTAKEMIPLGKFYPACAYCDETIWMYLAKGLVKGERDPDEDEFLDVELIPLKELVPMVLKGEIPDAKTQLAILKAAIYEKILQGGITMAKKNAFLNNLPEPEIIWADTKRWLGLPWTFTKYRVDEDRLYTKEGFLRTETDELLLYRILDIKSSQTLWQRICGVGTVTLYCSDKSDGVLELKNIKKYEQVRRFLSDLVEQKRTETGVKGREIYGAGNPVPHIDADGDGICDMTE